VTDPAEVYPTGVTNANSGAVKEYGEILRDNDCCGIYGIEWPDDHQPGKRSF
jgi:hypothetical protein